MNVTFNEDSFTVTEADGFVETCIVLEGLIERDVVVNVSTLDLTAKGIHSYNQYKEKNSISLYFLIAPNDYFVSASDVTFVPDSVAIRQLCSNVSIVVDNIVENSEIFQLILATSDSGVNILVPNVFVTITDNSSKLLIC